RFEGVFSSPQCEGSASVLRTASLVRLVAARIRVRGGTVLSLTRRVFRSSRPRFSLYIRSLHPELNFGLQIVAKIFRQDARSNEFAQIGNCQLRQIREYVGERRG